MNELKARADQVITVLKRQYQDTAIYESNAESADEIRARYSRMSLTSSSHCLFYRDAVIHGSTSLEDVGYVCYKCGVMMKPDMMKFLMFTFGFRHVGAYLNRLSPACHLAVAGLVPFDGNGEEIVITKIDYDHMIDPSLETMPSISMNQTIGDIFEWNFMRYRFTSDFSSKEDLKKIFIDQFNTYEVDERFRILRNVGEGQFNDDMTALFFQVKDTGIVPDIYQKIDPQSRKSLCGFDCDNVANIVFLPCGHIIYCLECLLKKTAQLKLNGCTKPGCCDTKITEYVSVETMMSYDLEGVEIVKTKSKPKGCCVCQRTDIYNNALYQHFKYDPMLGEASNNSYEEFVNVDPNCEKNKLDEASGGAELPEAIDNQKDVRKEQQLMHSICSDCAPKVLKAKDTSGMLLEGVCPICQDDEFRQFRKSIYIKIITT
ncbi:MAG: hypothetical protein KAG53_10725 [Endozoicomonadaceae bacterium]|nr:hypothetical protein [Endozoicomonadaceae bacterium]